MVFKSLNGFTPEYLSELFVNRSDTTEYRLRDIASKIIITQENDPANLLLFEAFYIRKYKPSLNSWDQCSGFSDLLF